MHRFGQGRYVRRSWAPDEAESCRRTPQSQQRKLLVLVGGAGALAGLAVPERPQQLPLIADFGYLGRGDRPVVADLVACHRLSSMHTLKAIRRCSRAKRRELPRSRGTTVRTTEQNSAYQYSSSR